MLNIFNQEKYKIHFLRNGKEIKTKTQKLDKNIVKLDKTKSYPIADTDISYRKGLTYHIFIDYDNGTVVKLNAISGGKINVSLIDLIMSTKTIQDLASRFNPTTTFGSLALTLTFILMGLAFGYILGNMFTIQNIQYAISHIDMPKWG